MVRKNAFKRSKKPTVKTFNRIFLPKIHARETHRLLKGDFRTGVNGVQAF